MFPKLVLMLEFQGYGALVADLGGAEVLDGSGEGVAIKWLWYVFLYFLWKWWAYTTIDNCNIFVG